MSIVLLEIAPASGDGGGSLEAGHAMSPSVTNCVTGHWSAVTASHSGPGPVLVPVFTPKSRLLLVIHTRHMGHGDTGTRDNVTRLRWEREWADTGDWRAGAACGHSEQEPGGDTEPPWEARWAEHGDMWSDNPANGKKIRPSLIKWKYIPLPSGQLIFGAILVIKTIKIRMMAFNLLGPRFQTDPLEPSDPRISYCWFYHSMPI